MKIGVKNSINSKVDKSVSINADNNTITLLSTMIVLLTDIKSLLVKQNTKIKYLMKGAKVD